MCIAQAFGAVMLARVLASSGNAPQIARDASLNKVALGALVEMLASPRTYARLASVRALAQIIWLVCTYNKFSRCPRLEQ